MLHQVCTTTEGRDRQAAADHFAQYRHVGFDAVNRLCAAECHAEARHHLIEHQYRAMLRAQPAHGLQEFRRRTQQVHVAGDRLDDDCSDGRAHLREHLLQLLAVVVVEHHRVLREVGWYAARGWVAEGEQAAASLHQQRVGVTVIAAFELDDGVPTGDATCQAQRAHRRLGARGHQANHLDRWHQFADFLGHHDLAFGRRAEGQAVGGSLLHVGDHVRVCMADDGRAPGADVVDVALVVGIPEVRALGALDEARRAADGTEGTHRRVHATGRALLCACEQGIVIGHFSSLAR